MAAISATVITYNEEGDIADCLRSLEWVDEIVLVDSGSTDRTVEIARAFTDRLFIRPWPGFSEQKNFAVGKTTGDWVLHVDADERITPALREEISGAINDPSSCDGYFMPRVNYWLGKPIMHGGYYPDYVLRLFRRGKATCTGMSHETFVIDGTIGRLLSPMVHYGCRSVREHVERAVLRSAPLDAKELVANGGSLYLLLPWPIAKAFLRQLIKGPRGPLAFRMLYKGLVKNRVELVWMLPLWPIVRFLDRFVFRRGFQDGTYGFWIAVLSAVYEAVRCALLWDHFIMRPGQGVLLPEPPAANGALADREDATTPSSTLSTDEQGGASHRCGFRL